MSFKGWETELVTLSGMDGTSTNVNVNASRIWMFYCFEKFSVAKMGWPNIPRLAKGIIARVIDDLSQDRPDP